MKNLEQIRAKNALEAAPKIGTAKEGGIAVVKKVATMIMNNGFLGAAAFSIETGAGYQDTFTAIIAHLKNAGMMHGIVQTDLNAFMSELCEKDATTLRAITAETMAYLNYLRRFAKPEKKDGSDEHNRTD